LSRLYRKKRRRKKEEDTMQASFPRFLYAVVRVVPAGEAGGVVDMIPLSRDEIERRDVF
jgi:Flp pilus assembly protein TadB